jgi:hypothetical protein
MSLALDVEERAARFADSQRAGRHFRINELHPFKQTRVSESLRILNQSAGSC